MSYRAILTGNAKNDLRAMPERVAQYVLLQLAELEKSPTALSRPSHFPFRLQCQLFKFDYDYDGKRYFINVLFQYGADEESLYILDAPFQAAESWWDFGDDDDNFEI
jgi:hypothetical protein